MGQTRQTVALTGSWMTPVVPDVTIDPAAVKANEIRAAMLQEHALWTAHAAAARRVLQAPNIDPALAGHFQAELASAQFELTKIVAKRAALDQLYPLPPATTGPIGP